jgi:ATP-dependent Clp protease ATP-binding subunit ClpA
VLSNFSAKAIEAIERAREEAKRLEFNQVDSDHLLLGLLAEGNGVAARALKTMGYDLRKARFATEQISGRGYMGNTDRDQLSFAPACTQIFDAALAIAGNTEPVLVDTQDLLFAILSRRESRGVEVLRQMRVDLDAFERRLMEIRNQDLASPTPPPPDPTHAMLPQHFNPRLLSELGEQVWEAAHQMARAFGHTIVGTEHLLIALLAVEEGLASQVLRENGLTRLEVEAVMHRVIGRGSGTLPSKLMLSRLGSATLDAAWSEARRRQHEQVGTGHMLVGLLQLDAGGALAILDMLRINLAGVQYDLEQAFDDAPDAIEPSGLRPEAGVPLRE